MPRPKRFLLWEEEDMVVVVDAVKSEELSIRKAAAEFHIPKSSLADRVIGKVEPGAKSGPNTLLSPEDEKN